MPFKSPLRSVFLSTVRVPWGSSVETESDLVLISDFDQSADPLAGFAASTLQPEGIATLTRVANPSGTGFVARFEAGPGGAQQGKSLASWRPGVLLKPGATIIFEFDFMWPSAGNATAHNQEIVDFECNHIPNSPGIRGKIIFDGTNFRVACDRLKIGGTQINASVVVPFGPDTWHKMRWEVTLGGDAGDPAGLGAVKASIDGVETLSATGRTMMTQKIWTDNAAPGVIIPGMTTVQIGATANDEASPFIVYVNDVKQQIIGETSPLPAVVDFSTTMAGINETLTLSEATTIMQDQRGIKSALFKTGMTVLSRDLHPATTIGGLPVNGTMKNPQRLGATGWDGRIPAYSAAANEAFPISLAAGDIIVVAVSGATPTDTRHGYVTSYDSFHFVTEPWLVNAIAPHPIGWSGRGAPTPYYVDCAAIAPGLPRYSLTNVSRPPLADVLTKIQREEISLAFTDSTLSSGYEQHTTQGATGTGVQNYGQYQAQWRGAAGLYLISDVPTDEEKAELLAWMIGNGLMFDVYEGAGNTLPANGGHFQFHFIDVVLALYYTGRAVKLADIQNVMPGNVLGQTFVYTADQVSQFAPHSDLTKACVSRIRSVTASSGVSVSIQTFRSGETGDLAQFGVTGMRLVRVSDGASAMVKAQNKTAIAANGNDTIVLTIDAQPTVPFAPSDDVYFEFIPGVQVGQVDWRIGPYDYAMNPNVAAVYRALNFWSEEFLVPRALNIWHDSWDTSERYAVFANQPDFPAAAHNYPTHSDLVGGYTFAGDFWREHAGAIIGDSPIFVSRPAISGQPLLGQTLTAIDGITGGITPKVSTRQWLLDGVAIAGEVGATYAVRPSDAGGRIGLEQTVTNASGTEVYRAAPTDAIAATYAINAVEFEAGEKAQLLSNFADTGGKTAMMAFNFYLNQAWPASGLPSILRLVNPTGGNVANVRISATGRMSINFYDSAAANVANGTSANNVFVGNTWYTVVAEIDTREASKRWSWYIRPAGGSWASVPLSSGGLSSVVTDGVVGNAGRCIVNEGILPGYFADVWASMNMGLDMSVPANRDKFLPSAHKGSNGSVITDLPPALFLSGATSTWHTNKGLGGGLDMVGTLSTAPSVPT